MLVLAGCAQDPKQQAKSQLPAAKGPAPAEYKVKLETTKGNVVIAVTRAWAPLGADRFYELVQQGFYDEAKFFRVRPKFIVQWGIAKDPKINLLWRQLNLMDDPVKKSNKRGFVSFAMAGPNTRTTQLFVNLVDNARLDKSGFAPFGEVIEGMEVFDQVFSGYGEVAPRGPGPDQSKAETQGNAYLEREYPRLDAIRKASVL